MAFMHDEPPLGSWLSDAISGVVHVLTQGGNSGPLSTTHGTTLPGFTPPPGWYAMSPASQQQYLDAMDSSVTDDLQLIQAWKDAVIAEGGYATRDAQGELAERANGPDTAYPNFPPPYTYVRAPANVIAADHRASAQLQPAVDSIVPRAPDALGGGGLPSIDWAKYLLWAAIGVGVVMIVPPLLSGATSASAARRVRRRLRR